MQFDHTQYEHLVKEREENRVNVVGAMKALVEEYREGKNAFGDYVSKTSIDNICKMIDKDNELSDNMDAILNNKEKA